MPVYALQEKRPQIHDSAWIAETATIIGDVSIGEQASVWFGVTIRGDNTSITIGNRSNVQENSVLHVDPGFELTVGDDVTIGHQVMLHGCTIGDNCLIGIQSVVMNGATIGKNCLVGAGALITEGKSFPDGSLIVGVPAKVLRPLTEDEIKRLSGSAANYVTRAELFSKELKPV